MPDMKRPTNAQDSMKARSGITRMAQSGGLSPTRRLISSKFYYLGEKLMNGLKTLFMPVSLIGASSTDRHTHSSFLAA